MAYKTVRRNGRDVLIDSRTGRVVQPGQRVLNELKWVGKGINDNFTYSDKSNPKTGQRLTPAEVRKIEGPKASSRTQKPASRQGPAVPARLRNAPAAPKLPAAAAAPRSSTPSRSSSTSARMPSSVTRSSTPKAPAAPAKPTERRVSASTANREAGNYGTSKTNNPLMKDFVGRMKDREDKAQASAASKVTSKFNTESNFSGEKVDGSNVNTKAKMKSTTSEYDKKKRRYGG